MPPSGLSVSTRVDKNGGIGHWLPKFTEERLPMASTQSSRSTGETGSTLLTPLSWERLAKSSTSYLIKITGGITCAAAALFSHAVPAASQDPAAIVPLLPKVAAEYTRPHELIDIGGGRKLNLFCMGTGPRTVMFDAGGSDWSVIWALVQPAVSSKARACTYDRAGLGYSDPAKGERGPINIVEDLRALIKSAKLTTPLVLVGHSLGGFNMKLYAALYPADVAGVVLLDPAEDRTDERTRAFVRSRLGITAAVRSELMDASFLRRLIGRYADCAAAARDMPLDAGSDFYRRCSDPVRPALGPMIAAERTRIQVKATYQQTQAAELADSVYGRNAHDEAYRALFAPGLLGSRPMIVLSHGNHDATDTVDAADFAAGLAMHCETAALSSRGELRIVEASDHNIELDRPDAVIQAVGDVLTMLDRQTDRRRRPTRCAGATTNTQAVQSRSPMPK